MKEDHIIVGIHVRNRTKHVQQVQAVLTAFADCIKTRIGLHELEGGVSSPNGLILIEFIGDLGHSNGFIAEIDAIEGVEARRMVFDHN